MAEFAIVPMSQLANYGRWDAGFHLAVARTAETVKQLEETYSEEQVVEMLGKLDTQTLVALKPLHRGSSAPRVITRDEYLRAAEAYPYIALALVREVADQNMTRIKDAISEKEKALADLRNVMGEDQ